MITIRRADERGHADHGWLDTRHTFSFADYHDPDHMGFRDLRVINEDRVQPGAGFPPHAHRDMEILSYVLTGALEHEDSLGNGSVIRAGELQRMTAGSGVRHSERNPSRSEPVHFLQIWIRPAERGLPPSYEQRAYPAHERTNALRVVASPSGRDGSLTIHQDAEVLSAVLEPHQRLSHHLAEGRHAWVQVVRGEVRVEGRDLAPGDGVGLSCEPRAELSTEEREAEVLVFDLA